MSLWQKTSAFLSSFFSGEIMRSIVEIFDADKWLPGGRDAAFTISLVALLAKMAAADGVVTNSEIAVFKSMVEMPKHSQKQIDKLFELAQQDIAGYKTYARKIARLFSDNPDMLERVLEALFQIASADGVIHEDEMKFLNDISEIFGFTTAKFEQIAAAFIMDEKSDNPYLVLGVSPNADKEEIKQAYHSLIKQYHPDRLIASGVPKEMINLSNQRMAAINQAYKRLMG